jgi:hypothetical protein
VESGWGVHLYWLLKDVVPLTSIEAAEQLLAAVNNYFLCRSQVKIDSMMRLPATFNGRVPGQMANCFVKYVNQDFRYALEDFAGLDLTVDGTGMQGEPAPSSDKPPVISAAVSASAANPESGTTGAAQRSQIWEPPPGVRVVPPAPKRGHLAPNAQGEASGKARSLQPQVKEVGPDAQSEVVETVEAEELSEALAEEIADKVVEKLTARLADKLVDQIVDRLYRLLNGK